MFGERSWHSLSQNGLLTQVGVVDSLIDEGRFELRGALTTNGL